MLGHGFLICGMETVIVPDPRSCCEPLQGEMLGKWWQVVLSFRHHPSLLLSTSESGTEASAVSQPPFQMAKMLRLSGEGPVFLQAPRMR